MTTTTKSTFAMRTLFISALLVTAGLSARGATAPNLGPNVLIFDPSMPAAAIQAKIDDVFRQQERAHFGEGRYALLFKPGTYDVNVRVGFFTQVLGLGGSPDDVTIHGQVSVDTQWAKGSALVNFWRSAENLSITPVGGPALWAVSQASPLRRVHVRGDLQLDDHGWSSGGFLADAVVDGHVRSGTQQQWLTRDSQLGGWVGSNWNMVFVGVRGAPSPSFPKPPYVVVDRAPIVREKPFLQLDAQGNLGVFVPALVREGVGPTWQHGPAAGNWIGIDQFYVARDTDSAATINDALAAGKNLLLTPGIYHLTEAIRVTRPDTVILGLGLATLVAEDGTTAMTVADVDGVTISGLLFDAGGKSSPILLQVGPRGSHADHGRNPTSLHDLFARVGGAGVGKAAVSFEINSNDVIGDDFWLWRADHGRGVSWTDNTADTGLIVNGANVTIYGLAVEHYQKLQTEWNADGGRVYFYQSEIPYDVPDQASWMRGAVDGFASYRVADRVTSHEAWGLGIYCFFNRNPAVKLASAIEAPRAPGVRFHDMTTVSLGGGKGEITHVVNDAGPTAGPAHIVSTLAEWP